MNINLRGDSKRYKGGIVNASGSIEFRFMREYELSPESKY